MYFTINIFVISIDLQAIEYSYTGTFLTRGRTNYLARQIVCKICSTNVNSNVHPIFTPDDLSAKIICPSTQFVHPLM